MSFFRIFLSVLSVGILSSAFAWYYSKRQPSAQQQETFAEPQKENSEKVKWHSFSEAVEVNKKEKRKIFIDVYTDWCGWCKVMDRNTFTNPVIIKYLNEKFYAVKLNAEMKDTIVFNNFTFVNPNPGASRSSHQIASSLLDNRMSYPTTVYLDENFARLQVIPGYQQPAQLEPILKYYGEGVYLNSNWEEFQKTFKSELSGQ